ncbi:DUF1674 domain-containing protein [Kiloniella litopenaei]|uniref:DUF1674 domain-containing protein n=1 Tax=Kiloniella litopenaei TaxID=1549748 RepID=UPI003BAAE9D7
MTRSFTTHTPQQKARKNHFPAPGDITSGAKRKKVTPDDLDKAMEARLLREKQLMEGLDKKPEIGGPSGPEPTRYGDWERKGICVDF